MAIKFQFTGLENAIKNIDNKTKSIENGVKDELNVWAETTVTLAKQNCPVDEGFLRNSIASNKATKDNLQAEITVGANYGAYLEFGTRKYATSYVAGLPTEWKELASTFKGGAKKGSFKEFLLNIILWVKRKGITGTYSVKTQKRTGKRKNFDNEDMAAAYPIALSIIKKGIKPQPYLFPAVIRTNRVLKYRIKKLLSK